MSLRNFAIYLLLFCSLITNNNEIYGQAEIDSLMSKDYIYLKKGFRANVKDSLIASYYVSAYIKKAKEEKDTIQLINGYYRKLMLDQKYFTRFDLYDTILHLSKNLRNQNFPTLAYYDKGNYYYKRRNFKEALKQYLLAINHNNGKNAATLEFLINHNIGLLKTRIDNDHDALGVFKKSWAYVNNDNYRNASPAKYLNVLFSISNSYRKNKILDTASFFNDLGIKESKLLEDEKMYYHFVLNKGIIYLENGELNKARDSILKGLRFITKMDDTPNKAVAYFYLGKVQMALGDAEKAIQSFKEVDSVYLESGDILPETSETYTYLINYHKEKDDFKNQLVYLNRLIAVDSILDSNFRFLKNEISSKYDLPQIENERQKIIDKINSRKNNFQLFLYVTLGILILVLIYGVNQRYKLLLYKKQFSQLMKNKEHELSTSHITETTQKNKKEGVKASLTIDAQIVNRVRQELEIFEQNQSFLDKEMSLSKMASQLNTNTNYLAKIIKFYRGSNYTGYIKELRVIYAFEKLKENRLFRNYTIKAIAEESGFKSSESFSKAFFLKYEIYPSFFVKQLKKNEQN
ncbi:helix-turn-helix domain-containing protein [Aquimarina sediminis]|uniref:helix-turn-helix domain-containing protein n=1 Tax=Aquimarina sediminis TaxID=2070536 RepID=UPI000CA011B0|nr:helix-turn-helix domain-containing protein [Aquimarina sediminis]